jgi:hypothetical protein
MRVSVGDMGIPKPNSEMNFVSLENAVPRSLMLEEPSNTHTISTKTGFWHVGELEG